MFQLKQGCYVDLPAGEISELMKLNSLEVNCRWSFLVIGYNCLMPTLMLLRNYSVQNASIQSLFNVANRILDESIAKKKGDIPNV